MPSATSSCVPSSLPILPEGIPRALPGRDGRAPLGAGERIVFAPYTKAVFAHVLQRISDRGIFPEGAMGSVTYEGSIICAAAKEKRPFPTLVGAGQGEGTIMEEGEHR